MPGYTAEVNVMFEADHDDDAIAFWQELPAVLAGGSTTRRFTLEVWELTDEEYNTVVEV